MIDSLKIFLGDYEMTGAACLEVQPAKYNAATGESTKNRVLWTVDGRPVTGEYATWNDEVFQVTIAPSKISESERMVCAVQMSIPKIATGNNYDTVGFKETKDALNTVHKHLREIGIKTTLKSATLGRVDACKTLRTDEPYSSYHQVLHTLSCKRQHQRDYGDSMLYHNSRIQLSFYDKLLEMKHRKRDVTGLYANSTRAELRLTKSQKIKETMGTKTLGDLISNYDIVRETYQKQMRQALFSRAPKEIQLMTINSVKEEIHAFIARGDRYWFQSWINATAYQRGIPDYNAVVQAIHEVAPNRMAARRNILKLQQARLDSDRLVVIAPCKRSIGELYDELKNKVLSA